MKYVIFRIERGHTHELSRLNDASVSSLHSFANDIVLVVCSQFAYDSYVDPTRTVGRRRRRRIRFRVHDEKRKKKFKKIIM
jgi:hypothetical protein